jgi:O-antigen/teichoic acid export membrane protein
LGLRVFTSFSAVIAIALIVYFRRYARETSLVILSIALWKGVDAVAEMYHGLLQRHERMDRIAKSLMFKGMAALAVFGTVICLTHSILWGTAGLTVASVIVLLSYDLPSAVLVAPLDSLNLAGRGKAIAHRSAKLAIAAFPLGIVMGLVSLNVNLPRYLIANSFGERELGIFVAMAYVIAAGNTLVEALGQAASPRLAKRYAVKDLVAFRRAVLKLVVFGALLGAAAEASAILGGSRILTILYGREYAARADVFCWLMAATPTMFAGSFLGVAMTAAGYFVVQIPLFLTTTCVTGLGCLFLLRSYGLRGVAMALLFSSLVQFAASAVIVLRACRKLKEEQTCS